MKSRVAVLSSFLAGFALVVACDPELTPEGTAPPPDAGSTTSSSTSSSSSSSSGTSEGGPTEGGDDGMASSSGEAGPTGHVIDGTNDFAAGEKLDTSSSAPKPYNVYVSWDASKIYLGLSGDDVGNGAGSDKKWFLVYFDGTPGSSTGIAYNAGGAATTPQQAKLPFEAGYHLRWKADGTYTNLQKWDSNASDWTPVVVTIDPKRSGSFVEMAVPRSVIGSPTKLKMVSLMSIESPGDEWTYAVSPKNGWTDGRYAAPQTIPKYWQFDLADTTKAPNAYTPLP